MSELGIDIIIRPGGYDVVAGGLDGGEGTAMALPEGMPRIWCESTLAYSPTRCHDDGTAYKCLSCGGRFTVKPEDQENVYPFSPGDVARAIRDGGAEPLF